MKQKDERLALAAVRRSRHVWLRDAILLEILLPSLTRMYQYLTTDITPSTIANYNIT